MPEPVRRAPKELLRKGLREARDKAGKQLIQASQNGLEAKEPTGAAEQPGTQTEAFVQSIADEAVRGTKQAAHIGSRKLAVTMRGQRTLASDEKIPDPFSVNHQSATSGIPAMEKRREIRESRPLVSPYRKTATGSAGYGREVRSLPLRKETRSLSQKATPKPQKTDY